jgi:hypothetical protein
MRPPDLHGRRIAVVITAKALDGEDERTVFSGEGVWDGEALYVDRGAKHPPFEIREEWLSLLTESEDERFDYVLTLHIQ